MYQQNGGFDEMHHVGGFAQSEDAFSAEEQSYPQSDVALLEMELQRHLEIQEMVHDASNWQEIAANFNAQSFLAAADIFPPPPPPPPPSLLANFFHSLPHAAGVYAHQNGCGDGVVNFEFTATEIGGKIGDGIKPVSSEKHRRVVLKDKYEALRALVPSPTKNDRASIVADAIVYINELKMTVTELKGLVERKRCARERLKRPKVEEEHYDGSSSSSSSLRSSWLHRKTKNTEVDVRIVDDEITVKLVQQKRINCLLFVSKVLDELHLDLHHVAGGLIGDYYSYLFNSKIGEGSIVYASAVANKLIEVVDKQYAAVPPTTTY